MYDGCYMFLGDEPRLGRRSRKASQIFKCIYQEESKRILVVIVVQCLLLSDEMAACYVEHIAYGTYLLLQVAQY